jgi:hypothetical protein
MAAEMVPSCGGRRPELGFNTHLAWGVFRLVALRWGLPVAVLSPCARRTDPLPDTEGLF